MRFSKAKKEALKFGKYINDTDLFQVLERQSEDLIQESQKKLGDEPSIEEVYEVSQECTLKMRDTFYHLWDVYAQEENIKVSDSQKDLILDIVREAFFSTMMANKMLKRVSGLMREDILDMLMDLDDDNGEAV